MSKETVTSYICLIVFILLIPDACIQCNTYFSREEMHKRYIQKIRKRKKEIQDWLDVKLIELGD